MLGVHCVPPLCAVSTQALGVEKYVAPSTVRDWMGGPVKMHTGLLTPERICSRTLREVASFIHVDEAIQSHSVLSLLTPAYVDVRSPSFGNRCARRPDTFEVGAVGCGLLMMY